MRTGLGQGDRLETVQGLFEHALYDFLLHATRPCIPHDVCSTAFVHETEGNVEFVAVDPASADTEDVWVL